MPKVATEIELGPPAEALIPDDPTLAALGEAAAVCRACELWTRGTRTVFGEGSRTAEVMFVGEQPGDMEDQEGRPFVGPAGRILDRAMVHAGIDRAKTYVTNAVKHFNWEETRGKRRIHKTPGQAHISACRPWLDSELAVVRPRVVVLLGSTAAQALLGRGFKVLQRRGEVLTPDFAPYAVATVHPSSVLRVQDDEERRAATAAFVDDLRQVAALIKG
jgi:DNA polymerase